MFNICIAYLMRKFVLNYAFNVLIFVAELFYGLFFDLRLQGVIMAKLRSRIFSITAFYATPYIFLNIEVPKEV